MWGRIIRLEVWDTKGDLILDTSDLRIDFSYSHSWGLNDLCTIKILNLAPNTFKTLTTHQAMKLKLSAGYRDSGGALPVVIEGHVSNVWGQKIVPNHYTTIFCVPSALYTATANRTVPSSKRGGTFADHLNALSKALLFTTPVEYLDPMVREFSKTVMAPVVVDTTIYNELAAMQRRMGARIRIIDGGMSVMTDPKAEGALEANVGDTSKAPVVLQTQYLRGTPKLSVSEIEIPYVLSTQLHSGDVIDIGVPSTPNSVASTADISGLGQNLNRDTGIIDNSTNQYYMIMTIDHSGSAFSRNWQSIIRANTYSIDTKGLI